jgi:signal transduction histidine kinase
MTELDEQAGVGAPAKDNSQNNAATENESVAGTEPEMLRALVAAYEAKIDEATEVIARVRHEINNPLTGILGQAQLLLREDLNERTRKRAETIEQLAVRLRDIVAQLRQVQKPPKI